MHTTFSKHLPDKSVSDAWTQFEKDWSVYNKGIILQAALRFFMALDPAVIDLAIKGNIDGALSEIKADSVHDAEIEARTEKLDRRVRNTLHNPSKRKPDEKKPNGTEPNSAS